MTTVSNLQLIVAALLLAGVFGYLGWKAAWAVASNMSENLANEAWDKVKAQREDPVQIAAKKWIPFSKRCRSCDGSGREKS